MSRRKLATYVHVADDQQQMHVFGPDDEVPDWAVGRIVNPKAWKDGKVPAPAESPADELARLQARINALKAAVGDGRAESQGDNPGDGDGDGDGPPPRSGAGSGAAAWREYAGRRGVEVPADASREDVIAALSRAGVRTE